MKKSLFREKYYTPEEDYKEVIIKSVEESLEIVPEKKEEPKKRGRRKNA